MAKVYKPSKTFEVYGGKIKIDFYERNGRFLHVYIRRDTGEWLTSVTGATGMIDKPLLIPWACKEMEKAILETFKTKKQITNKDIAIAKNAWRAKRDKSAEKGTIIHELAESYIKYKLGQVKKMPPMPKDKEIKNAYMAFRAWESEHNVKFIATEQLVYSKKYNFVGTLDCIAEVDKEYCLVDFKSGNGVYGEAIYQVSGYGEAHTEETGKVFDRNWIVRFGKDDGEFYAKDFYTNKQLVKGFLSCLYLKGMKKEVDAMVK